MKDIERMREWPAEAKRAMFWMVVLAMLVGATIATCGSLLASYMGSVETESRRRASGER